MGFISYIRAARHIYSEITKQKQYINHFLVPYLDKLESKYNGKFHPEQKQKIIKYYGLFITSFLCSSYKRLYGKNLSIDERERATLFGILTPVGDDLFDIDKLSYESIRQITFNPENFNASSFSSHIAKEIQTYLLQHVPNKKVYLQASEDVLNIQIETSKQTNRDISFDDLERITFTKGAVSVIIYHQCLDETASPQMLEALFFVGSLYQWGNDLFDLYKDVRDNIYTLVNTCDDFEAMRHNFIERVRLQNQLIMKLPFNKKDKEEFCIVMNTINARSMVALNQFIKLEKNKGKSINWWNLNRKIMIVDMEKPKNILYWLYYMFRLPGII